MLQIYLYGPVANGFIDLTAGTQLQIEALSEIFDEDLSIGEYSLPITIPWTENNLKLTGFANRIKNYSRGAVYFEIDVYANGLPELQRAKLTIQEKSGSLSMQRGSFTATISSTKGLYGSLIKNKKLADLKLGGIINFETGYNCREWATARMQGLFPDYHYVGFAPVAMEDFFDTNRTDYAGEFLVKDTVNYAMATGSGADDWKFARPSSADPSVSADEGEAEFMDYRTVPYLKVKWLLQQCFAEFGFTVTGEFISSADFDSLYLFSNYSIDNFAQPLYNDLTNNIDPAKLVPDISIKDFIKNLCKTLGMYPVFGNNNVVQLRYRKNTLNLQNTADVTAYIGSEYSSTAAEDADTDGYSIAYAFDSNDGMVNDRVFDDTKTVAATVTLVSDLDTLSLTGGMSTDTIVLVTSVNRYYRVADATGSPILWDAIADRLNAYKIGNGERTIELPVSTLCSYIVKNVSTALDEPQGYLGCRQRGSYINNRGIRVTAPMGLRMFYISKRNIGGALVPYSHYHNRDEANNKILPYSLSLISDEGLVSSFHKRWEDIRQGAEIIKTTINLDRRIYDTLMAKDMWIALGIYYLPYRMERTLPLDGTAQVELLIV
jgi:hypothetical protein